MSDPIDPAEYCRTLEAYLCQKNEGHLIRIVGPVFEQVCGWAAQGVPLAVAKKGIDQYCERYYARGPRRRPVRIEFCEADILDLFDGWRRAVGVSNLSGGEEAAARGAQHDSLPAHLDRVIARLTALRAGTPPAGFAEALADAVRQLDAQRASARRARGAERAALLQELSALDDRLLAAARGGLADAELARLQKDADAEIAPFAARMPAAERDRAARSALDRLVREAAGLPVVAFEQGH
jgi:hypothetical protein